MSFRFKGNISERQWEYGIFFLAPYFVILLATNDYSLLYETRNFLFKNFEMKNMGETSFVINDRLQELLSLFHKVYINKVLERFRMVLTERRQN
jgi:hypothetical protein